VRVGLGKTQGHDARVFLAVAFRLAGGALTSLAEVITMHTQTITMHTPIVPTDMREVRQRLDVREQAALRRVGAQMIAEAAELPPTTWVAEHLRLEVDEWGERVLPELALHMAVDRRQDAAEPWIRRRSDRCPLTLEEEACLRRVASFQRAEATELGSGSSVGARLDSWGIRLALECENPSAPGPV
jgi:hypothetical protein